MPRPPSPESSNVRLIPEQLSGTSGDEGVLETVKDTIVDTVKTKVLDSVMDKVQMFSNTPDQYERLLQIVKNFVGHSESCSDKGERAAYMWDVDDSCLFCRSFHRSSENGSITKSKQASSPTAATVKDGVLNLLRVTPTRDEFVVETWRMGAEESSHQARTLTFPKFTATTKGGNIDPLTLKRVLEMMSGRTPTPQSFARAYSVETDPDTGERLTRLQPCLHEESQQVASALLENASSADIAMGMAERRAEGRSLVETLTRQDVETATPALAEASAQPAGLNVASVAAAGIGAGVALLTSKHRQRSRQRMGSKL